MDWNKWIKEGNITFLYIKFIKLNFVYTKNKFFYN
jgi:hypothetical protein